MNSGNSIVYYYYIYTQRSPSCREKNKNIILRTIGINDLSYTLLLSTAHMKRMCIRRELQYIFLLYVTCLIFLFQNMKDNNWLLLSKTINKLFIVFACLRVCAYLRMCVCVFILGVFSIFYSSFQLFSILFPNNHHTTPLIGYQ